MLYSFCYTARKIGGTCYVRTINHSLLSSHPIFGFFFRYKKERITKIIIDYAKQFNKPLKIKKI